MQENDHFISAFLTMLADLSLLAQIFNRELLHVGKT